MLIETAIRDNAGEINTGYPYVKLLIRRDIGAHRMKN